MNKWLVQVQMQLPEGADYCTTYADCAARFPDAMSKWDAFYQVPALSEGSLISTPPFIKNYNHILNLSLSLSEGSESCVCLSSF